jgi:TonB family protein
MLSILLLSSVIEFGVVKGCADSKIERLEPFETTVEYIRPTTEMFERNTFYVESTMPSACALINTVSVVEFDIDKNGVLTNYKIISSNPPRIHTRKIKRAFRRAKVLPQAFGTFKNRIKVTYRMYKHKI